MAIKLFTFSNAPQSLTSSRGKARAGGPSDEGDEQSFRLNHMKQAKRDEHIEACESLPLPVAGDKFSEFHDTEPVSRKHKDLTGDVEDLPKKPHPFEKLRVGDSIQVYLPVCLTSGDNAFCGSHKTYVKLKAIFRPQKPPAAGGAASSRNKRRAQGGAARSSEKPTGKELLVSQFMRSESYQKKYEKWGLELSMQDVWLFETDTGLMVEQSALVLDPKGNATFEAICISD